MHRLRPVVMRTTRPVAAALATLAAAALLAGCAAAAPMVQPAAGAAPFPEELETYYTQELDWSECGDGFECADVTVPMDYDEPDGETISIAVKVLQAGGESLGALFINPGGPGGSGIELVENASSTFGDPLLESYDIVGFDPRGVGASTAVRCYDSAQLDDLFSRTYDLTTDRGFDRYLSDLTAYGEACEANTGELVHHLDTVTAARDLDVLRAALHQPQLTYLGYSYGTFLGAIYAEHFPDSVGRLVLDGAVDPSLNYAEITQGQIAGFDVAYRSYLEDCLSSADCPFTGDVDAAVHQTTQLVHQLADTPAPSGDPERPVTDSDLYNAIVIALYSPDSWPVLTSAMAALINNDDGAQIRFLADVAMERDDNGEYPEDEGAFRLIDCSDYPVELDQQRSRELAEENAEISELFGEAFSYGEVGCAAMPITSDAVREPIHAEGTPPIVVIGTTRDPATPYDWAESLAEQLDSGVLIGYEGDGHTAYGGVSSCVDTAVESFLIDGVVPEDGLRC